ncbi:hypothetical protein [Pseudomonas sp. Sample_22]|uniref:hypothetical protein n=1 Tax=Pseudomonas sp. Sample_22 TaxID=2448266 RepID=UPI001032E171|nr:hypothetical protein [Pseudomonas sp. Sample_22]
MITNVRITISINKIKEMAQLICDDSPISITLLLDSGLKKTYTGLNFYKCFGQLREDNAHIDFLCKGSKINVHPSSMSSQMTQGLKAYELALGKAASLKDVVYIFDYDDENLTNNPSEQREFYMRWINTEKSD